MVGLVQPLGYAEFGNEFLRFEIERPQIPAAVLRNSHDFVAKADVQREFLRNTPVVLEVITLAVLVDVVEDSVSYRSRRRGWKPKQEIRDRVARKSAP